MWHRTRHPSERAKRPPLHLVASAGGHLDLLDYLEPATEGWDVTWVASPGWRADAIAARGERVLQLPLFQGRRFGRLRNIVAALALVLRERPRVIVTSG